MFASRTDLLARSNAQRLGQLAVPADMDMVPDEALRLAIDDGDLSGYTQAEQDALALALAAIDNALEDATALVLSYGIPATVQTALLARITSTIALYYLQGAEHITDDIRKAYDDAVDKLKAHAKGILNLLPIDESQPAPSDDMAIIESRPGRYGARRRHGDDCDFS
ncbi:phage protein Gp36 family protein [Herbaspirillum chlorophenolicum]|uniref:phage protein Gp36 family protein n=1 Tax=Herbaspirillum chlorophenolicum TaxID=211589 RepID=UPI00067D45CF|nr:phage protein Gp36 family protein [Herbaspirillum chlorophenolicum]